MKSGSPTARRRCFQNFWASLCAERGRERKEGGLPCAVACGAALLGFVASSYGHGDVGVTPTSRCDFALTVWRACAGRRYCAQQESVSLVQRILEPNAEPSLLVLCLCDGVFRAKPKERCSFWKGGRHPCAVAFGPPSCNCSSRSSGTLCVRYFGAY